jgi:hypothetical protein
MPNPGLAFMPRLNAAWDIGGKGDWVIRAGAGIFYNRVQGNYDYYSSGQMPNTYSATIDTPWNNAPGGSGGISFANLKDDDPFAFANVNVSSSDVNSNDLPRVANMSLTVEKKAAWKQYSDSRVRWYSGKASAAAAIDKHYSFGHSDERNPCCRQRKSIEFVSPG